jgi:hypothetical protein
MQLSLLGRPALTDTSGRPVRLPAKGWALLSSVLTDHQGAASREALVVLLYPDSSADAGQAAFRQLLKRTAAAVTTDCIGFDNSQVWAGRALKSSDLGELLGTRSIPDLRVMTRLASAFGPLLDGVAFDETELQLWLGARRRTITEHFLNLISTGARTFPGRATTDLLLAVASKLPDSLVIGEALVTALVADGRMAEAAGVISRFDELAAAGIVPGAAPANLQRILLSGSPRMAAQAIGMVAPPGPPSSSTGVPRIILLRPRKATYAPVDRQTLRIVDSIIEDVAIELSSAHELAVVAPHTAWRIADGHPATNPLLQAVEFVLHTRVRSEDGAASTVNMMLVRTLTQEVVWAEQGRLNIDSGSEAYQWKLRSLIAGMLGSIERVELAAFRRTGTPTAYRHYLMGRHHLRTLSLPDVRRARRWFRSAGEIDPHFARAFGWEAQTLVLEWVMMTGKDPEQLQAAQVAAHKAIALDPNDASAYRAMARAALFRGVLDQSLEYFELAERFAPHFADGLADYADTLVHNSMVDRAKEKMDLALHLNPIPPDTYLWIAAGIDFLRRDFGAALDQLRRMTNPDQGYRLMAASAAMLGDRETARTYRDAALSIDPTFEVRAWTQRLPLRDRNDLELYVTALERAGFH